MEAYEINDMPTKAGRSKPVEYNTVKHGGRIGEQIAELNKSTEALSDSFQHLENDLSPCLNPQEEGGQLAGDGPEPMLSAHGEGIREAIKRIIRLTHQVEYLRRKLEV